MPVGSTGRNCFPYFPGGYFVLMSTEATTDRTDVLSDPVPEDTATPPRIPADAEPAEESLSEAARQYQALGAQLDHAAKSLRKSRKRVAATAPAPTANVPLEVAAESAVPVTQAPEPNAPADSAPETHPDGIVTATADETASAEAADNDNAPGALFPAALPPGTETSPAKPAIDLAMLEALLFTTRHPLSTQRVGEMMDVPSAKILRNAVAELNRQYEATGRSFRIEQVAGGYQMLTLAEYGPLLNKLYQREVDSKLSRSALETLAIIAYKQPVLRAEVEAIRGVASGETIRNLMEKHLVKIAGRAEEAGRPILYGTTKRFLEIFGLNSLKELPREDAATPAARAASTTPAPIPAPPAPLAPADNA